MSQHIDFSGTHTFLIVDLRNLAMRARFHAHGETPEEKVGMTMHIVLNSIRAGFKKFDATHLVVCTEGRSFRKDLYPKYKANRTESREQRSLEEQREDELLFKAIDDFRELVKESNATMLRCELTEADDLIARWIDNHPNDQHVLVSSDSDFVQLVQWIVLLIDRLKRVYITPDGVFDEKGKALAFSIGSNGKIKIEKRYLDKGEKPDVPEEFWEFAKFVKCVKGDSSDNIFTAYPGVRMKGTKKKVGIIEAFNDRKKQGFDYLNFMNHRYEDPEGNQVLVKDGFLLNESLIDLRKQPEEIKILLDRTIESAKEHKGSNIGLKFMQFAGRYGLSEIGAKAPDYLAFLSKGR